MMSQGMIVESFQTFETPGCIGFIDPVTIESHEKRGARFKWTETNAPRCRRTRARRLTKILVHVNRDGPETRKGEGVTALWAIVRRSEIPRVWPREWRRLFLMAVRRWPFSGDQRRIVDELMFTKHLPMQLFIVHFVVRRSVADNRSLDIGERGVLPIRVRRADRFTRWNWRWCLSHYFHAWELASINSSSSPRGSWEKSFHRLDNLDQTMYNVEFLWIIHEPSGLVNFFEKNRSFSNPYVFSSSGPFTLMEI